MVDSIETKEISKDLWAMRSALIKKGVGAKSAMREAVQYEEQGGDLSEFVNVGKKKAT